MRDGKGTDALAKALLPKASLTVTDESYDVTSYVSSSLFEVTQVMGASSSRDGKAAVFYGLERLSQATESTTSAFIHDGRGSVVQTTVAGSVTSWKRYSAFGAVTAGTDPAEKPFFGYDAEEQDPTTGLTYLRARYYDPASARFGVADTYRGNTFDPITLNRYLYCASDPVNHVDPSGHLTLAQRQILDRRTYGKAITNSVGYNMTRQNKSAKEVLRQQREKQKATALSKIRFVLGGRVSSGSPSRGSSGKIWAQRLQHDYHKRYCELNPRIMNNEVSRASNHLTLDILGFVVPVVPDALNALLYALEGDNESAISSGISAIASLGSAPGKLLGKGAGFALKAGGKGVGAAAKTEKYVKSGTEIYRELENAGQVTRLNQMQMMVEKNNSKKLKDVTRIDSAHNPSESWSKPHVHFSDGTAMNYDGTVHDKDGGIHKLSKDEKEWLEQNGWATEVKEG